MLRFRDLVFGLLFLSLATDAAGENALKMVNRQRAACNRGSLVIDPSLQAAAEYKAALAAKRRHRGHLGGSLYGANYEGIGYGSQKRFRACYLYTVPAGSRCGAAMVRGSDGLWYCCLLVKSRLQIRPK